MVRWEIVCKPIAQGGLGIRSGDKVNKALLGKWLWRLGELGQGLWSHLFQNPFEIPNPPYHKLCQNPICRSNPDAFANSENQYIHEQLQHYQEFASDQQKHLACQK